MKKLIILLTVLISFNASANKIVTSADKTESFRLVQCGVYYSIIRNDIDKGEIFIKRAQKINAHSDQQLAKYAKFGYEWVVAGAKKEFKTIALYASEQFNKNKCKI